MRLPIAAVPLLAVPVFLMSGAAHANAQSPNNRQLPSTPPPKSDQVQVEVKQGDSLSKIASDHQTTYPRLYGANPSIVNPDLIYQGDKVRIPKPDEQLAHRTLPSNASAITPAKPLAVSKSTSASAKTSYVAASGGGAWTALAQCEAGGDWAANTGNGYYGGLQFTLASWRAAGGIGYPNQATSAEQIARAQVLLSRQGWSAWPACSAKLGL